MSDTTEPQLAAEEAAMEAETAESIEDREGSAVAATDDANDAAPIVPDVEPWPLDRVVAALEALLFASPDVLSFRALRAILPEPEVTNDALRDGLSALRERFERTDSGIHLTEVAGGFQFQTRSEYYDQVRALAKRRTEEKITKAALETLAIIAYKQPITRAEVDAIRGVGCGQLIRTLMDKKMVRVVGRADVPGHPFLYGTTKHFLEHFGLRRLADLPQESDL